ncbi:MAG: ribonuclease P protein component [Dehalococcoidia bacterium]|nr:ribonuclease P protein component [Dehalococcoidia bacterium]
MNVDLRRGVDNAQTERLTRKEDFTRVVRQGRAYGNPLLLLRAAPNGMGVTRIGFAVGKQVGQAVTRNLVRRRLREAIRRMPILEGWDVVITARKPSAICDYHVLAASLVALSGRLNLLKLTTAATEVSQ